MNTKANRQKFVISGYLPEEAWKRIEEDITISHKVLLLPQAHENYTRDVGRVENIRMGQEAINTHRNYFASTVYFNDFTRLDTSAHSIEDSVDTIKESLGA